MADSKLTALAELSVPALEDLTLVVDDPSGTPVSNKLTLARHFGLSAHALCQGRLTTESGVAISTSDRTAQSTIYFTPYLGNRVGLFDGTRWKLYIFTERSLALSGLTSGKNYDVFLYDNSGTLTLELSAAWTNDTTRADTLTLQDGVHVKASATTRRYLGTIRTTGTTTTEDSGGGVTSQTGGRRFVWSLYNRVPRHLAVHDTTDTWTYSTATVRQANAAAGNKVEFVIGLALDQIWAEMLVTVNINVGANPVAGIGFDSTTTLSGLAHAANVSSGNIDAPLVGLYSGMPSAGYHFLAWNEINTGGAGTAIWTGDAGASAGAGRQSGLRAIVHG